MPVVASLAVKPKTQQQHDQKEMEENPSFLLMFVCPLLCLWREDTEQTEQEHLSLEYETSWRKRKKVSETKDEGT